MRFIKNLIADSALGKRLRRVRENAPRQDWTAHDQEMLAFYSRFAARGETCFDVGANVGNRVKIFLKMRARVVAVEPQAACAAVLREKYGANANLTIVEEALGEAAGEAEIMVSNAHTISSLSPEWIESVKKSGRFAKFNWDKRQTVRISTLDMLISRYGRPQFIKIDVEGYEYQVVKGLSQPVRTISLEFTPEFIDSTFACLRHLSSLGEIRVNYSVGESMRLALDKWVGESEMVAILSEFRTDHRLFGDVYVQFIALT